MDREKLFGDDFAWPVDHTFSGEFDLGPIVADALTRFCADLQIEVCGDLSWHFASTDPDYERYKGVPGLAVVPANEKVMWTDYCAVHVVSFSEALRRCIDFDVAIEAETDDAAKALRREIAGKFADMLIKVAEKIRTYGEQP